GVLFTRATGFAMLAHTGASPQAQRTQRGGPEKGGLFSEPLLDIGERLSSTWHGACVPYNTHACQLKNENPKSHGQLRVSRQKLARKVSKSKWSLSLLPLCLSSWGFPRALFGLMSRRIHRLSL